MPSMRDIMRVVESLDPDDEESIKAHIRSIAPEIDADRVVEWVSQLDDQPDWEHDLEPAITQTLALSRKPTLDVYRVMTLEDEEIAQLKPGMSLGFHWAFDPGFDFSNLYFGRGPRFMFSGIVRNPGLSLEETIANNVSAPQECEVIFARYPVAVKITRIMGDNGDHNAGFAHPVRNDLWGQTFMISGSRD